MRLTPKEENRRRSGGTNAQVLSRSGVPLSFLCHSSTNENGAILIRTRGKCLDCFLLRASFFPARPIWSTTFVFFKTPRFFPPCDPVYFIVVHARLRLFLVRFLSSERSFLMKHCMCNVVLGPCLIRDRSLMLSANMGAILTTNDQRKMWIKTGSKLEWQRPTFLLR